jgi:hypothetical protein
MKRPWEEWACAKCHVTNANAPKGREVSERHSFGVYAGRYCDPCWKESGYRDVDDPDAEFDPADAGESMDPEPSVGGIQDDWDS